MAANVAEIRANAQIYTAWESVLVHRDFGDGGISSFEFTAAEDAYGPGSSQLKLQPSDKVQIYLAGQKIIDGAVTTRTVSYDSKSHQVVIAGLSLTQEINRSSVKVQPGTFDGSTFEQAARSVLGQQGIGLNIVNPPDIASMPFKNLTVQIGETIAEFVTRIAWHRGMFLTDDENGNLVAGQLDLTAAPVATLQEGVNILRAVGKLDDQTAWGKTSAISQGPADDNSWPNTRNFSASLTDGNSPHPNRFKLFVAEHPSSSEELAERVNYDRARADWQTVQCTVTVVGWTKPDGTLWKPVENISIYSPMIFPTASGAYVLGIQSCTYAQDSQNGTTTTFLLVKPNALSTKPTNGVPDAKPDAPDTQAGA